MNAAGLYAPASAPAYASAFPSYDDAVDSSFSSASASASSSSSSSLLIRALLVIILLALIGFNAFTYLDDITQWFSDTFGAPFREVARFLGRSRMMPPAAPNAAAERRGIATLVKTGDLEAVLKLANKTRACRGTFFQHTPSALTPDCENRPIPININY